MASDPTLCSICGQSDQSTLSTDWCSECNQAFCTACKRFHSYSSLSKDHVTIPISDYSTLLKSSLSEMSSFCPDHDDKYILLCQSHDCLLCPSCVEKHTACKDLMSLSKITKDVKTSEEFMDTEQSLADIETNIEKTTNSLREISDDMKEQRKAILLELSSHRKMVNDHFDQIENKLRDDLSNLDAKSAEDVYKALQQLEEKKRLIPKYQKQLTDLKNYGSDHLTYLSLRNLSAGIRQIEQFLQSMLQSGKFDRVVFKCEIEGKIVSMPKEIPTFGSVTLDKVKSHLTFKNRKSKQAQFVGSSTMKLINISTINFKLIKTIFTNGEAIVGCDIFSDGKMIFSDYQNGNIRLIDRNSFTESIYIGLKQPFDVKVINETTAAVTIVGRKEVILVDITKKNIKSVVSMKQDQNYGMAFKDGFLLYCAAGKGIQRINIEEGTIENLVKFDLPPWTYVASFEDKFYYTTYRNNTVHCCDMTGRTLWTFNDTAVLRQPWGIAVDNFGNAYVVGRLSSNVVLISMDGKQQSRQLLSSNEGLEDPRAIYYDRMRNCLLVANKTSNAFLFEIQSDPIK